MKNLVRLMFLFLIFGIFLILSLANVTAYYWRGYDDYSNTFYEKKSYGYDGYQYTKREVKRGPWGEKIVYIKVKDYDDYKRDYYPNRVYAYWGEGPYQKRYLGYGWDDSWRRHVFNSQYHSYYYEPRYFYKGDYYNWHGKEPDCKTIRYCNW